MGDKAFFTEEEAQALEAGAVAHWERAAQPGGARTMPLPPGSRMVGYNAAWNDLRNKMPYTRRTSMVTSPGDGRVPLSPVAAARRDELNARKYEAAEYLSPYERCITRGVPGSWLPNTYNTGHHVLQVPGYVVIVYEMMRDVRIIPIDGRPHLTPAITTWMGDFPRPLGRRDAGCRDDELQQGGLDLSQSEQRTDPRGAGHGRPEGNGAFHPDR